MGAFNLDSSRANSRRLRARRRPLVALATLGALIAPALAADEPRPLAPKAGVVQTRPAEVAGSPNGFVALSDARTSAPAEVALPLTRAAHQQRVETMSPMDWLTGFGDVVVGRPATTAANSLTPR